MDIQNGNNYGVKAEHGHDLHPLADHMTKFLKFCQGRNLWVFNVSIFISINVGSSIK